MDKKIYYSSLAAVILCSFFPMFIVACYFTFLPWNMNRLNIDETDVGFFLLIFGIFFILSNQISARVLVPKFGTKIIMSIAIIIIAISNLFLITSPNYFYLLVFAIPTGIGWGSNFPITGIHANLIEKHSKKIILPYFAMGFHIGMFIGAISAGFFINYELVPKYIFFTLFVISIFLSLVIYNLGLPKKLDFKGKGEKLQIPEKKILVFGLLLFIIFGSTGIVIDWSSLWLTKDLKAPLYLGGLGLIFFSCGGIFANLFSNQLINFFSEKIVSGIFVLIGSSILFISIIIFNLYLILFSLLLYGFLTSNFVPLIIRQAVRQSTENISITVSNLITMGLSSMFIGPAIVGFVAETYSLTINMYAMCILIFIAGIIFLNLFKPVNN